MMVTVVDRAEGLKVMSAHLPVLVREFNVRSLALFGSVVRGVARRMADCQIPGQFTAGRPISGRFTAFPVKLLNLEG